MYASRPLATAVPARPAPSVPPKTNANSSSRRTGMIAMKNVRDG
jgi:hypothetical protein